MYAVRWGWFPTVGIPTTAYNAMPTTHLMQKTPMHPLAHSNTIPEFGLCAKSNCWVYCALPPTQGERMTQLSQVPKVPLYFWHSQIMCDLLYQNALRVQTLNTRGPHCHSPLSCGPSFLLVLGLIRRVKAYSKLCIVLGP